MKHSLDRLQGKSNKNKQKLQQQLINNNNVEQNFETKYSGNGCATNSTLIEGITQKRKHGNMKFNVGSACPTQLVHAIIANLCMQIGAPSPKGD